MKTLSRHDSTVSEPDNRRYLRTSKTMGLLIVRYAPRDELPQYMDSYTDWPNGGEEEEEE